MKFKRKNIILAYLLLILIFPTLSFAEEKSEFGVFNYSLKVDKSSSDSLVYKASMLVFNNTQEDIEIELGLFVSDTLNSKKVVNLAGGQSKEASFQFEPPFGKSSVYGSIIYAEGEEGELLSVSPITITKIIENSKTSAVGKVLEGDSKEIIGNSISFLSANSSRAQVYLHEKLQVAESKINTLKKEKKDSESAVGVALKIILFIAMIFILIGLFIVENVVVFYIIVTLLVIYILRKIYRIIF